MPPAQPAGPVGQAAPACVRHPDRPTGLRCARCDRPACPDCLREASVGFQCVDCVNEASRTGRRWRSRTVAGATVPEGRAPLVVPVLILLNVVVYAVTSIQAGTVATPFGSSLYQNWVLWPVAARNGGWWQFVTDGFLHNNPLHIAGNMFALWVFGRDLERVLGRGRFLAVYLVSLVGGSVSVYLFGNQFTPVAGASGAVFGLLGGVLVVVLRVKQNPGSVIGMIAINLALSAAIPGISLLGHVGGLVVGALVTAAIVYAPAANRLVWQGGAVVVALVALVGLILLRDAQIPQLVCQFGSKVGCR